MWPKIIVVSVFLVYLGTAWADCNVTVVNVGQSTVGVKRPCTSQEEAEFAQRDKEWADSQPEREAEDPERLEKRKAALEALIQEKINAQEAESK